MGGRYRQAEDVRHADHARRGDLCRHALCVGHALFADLLADGQYHAFPANHGTQAKSEGDGQDYPERGIFGGGGQVFAQLVQVGLFTGVQVRQLADFLCRVVKAEQIATDFDAAFLRQRMVVGYTFESAQQRVDGRFGLLRVATELLRQIILHTFAQGQELTQGFVIALVELVQVQGGVASPLDLVGRAVQVEYELRRYDTDQYQHDQADAFLAIVGAVHKAHRHRRDHQDQTVPERWVLLVINLAALVRCLVHLGQRTPPLEAKQYQGGNGETGHWRDHQRGADIDSFLPVNTVNQWNVVDQGVGQAHAQDRTDQGVRAGSRDTEVPGAQVPGDGRSQQREHHRQPVAGVHIDQQFYRQQMDDGIRHADTAQQHAKKVEYTGKEYRQVGRHGFGVDNSGYRVSGVMKAVDELEGEDKGQGEQEAHKHPSIQSAE
ncbi:hypothetical protein D3C78_554090 [compost metagenome]